MRSCIANRCVYHSESYNPNLNKANQEYSRGSVQIMFPPPTRCCSVAPLRVRLAKVGSQGDGSAQLVCKSAADQARAENSGFGALGTVG